MSAEDRFNFQRFRAGVTHPALSRNPFVEPEEVPSHDVQLPVTAAEVPYTRAPYNWPRSGPTSLMECDRVMTGVYYRKNTFSVRYVRKMTLVFTSTHTKMSLQERSLSTVLHPIPDIVVAMGYPADTDRHSYRTQHHNVITDTSELGLAYVGHSDAMANELHKFSAYAKEIGSYGWCKQFPHSDVMLQDPWTGGYFLRVEPLREMTPNEIRRFVAPKCPRRTLIQFDIAFEYTIP